MLYNFQFVYKIIIVIISQSVKIPGSLWSGIDVLNINEDTSTVSVLIMTKSVVVGIAVSWSHHNSIMQTTSCDPIVADSSFSFGSKLLSFIAGTVCHFHLACRWPTVYIHILGDFWEWKPSMVGGRSKSMSVGLLPQLALKTCWCHTGLQFPWHLKGYCSHATSSFCKVFFWHGQQKLPMQFIIIRLYLCSSVMLGTSWLDINMTRVPLTAVGVQDFIAPQISLLLVMVEQKKTDFSRRTVPRRTISPALGTVCISRHGQGAINPKSICR